MGSDTVAATVATSNAVFDEVSTGGAGNAALCVADGSIDFNIWPCPGRGALRLPKRLLILACQSAELTMGWGPLRKRGGMKPESCRPLIDADAASGDDAGGRRTLGGGIGRLTSGWPDLSKAGCANSAESGGGGDGAP